MRTANSGPRDVFSAPGTAGGGSAPPPAAWGRTALVQGGLIVFALALIGRSAQVQLVQRDMWRARASAQQLAANPLPAPRGTILDATGVVLVESRQLVKLSVAPREVVADQRNRGDGRARMAALADVLSGVGVPADWVARVRDTTRAWVEIPGRFLATDVAAAMKTRGVHAEPALERVPPANDGLRRLIGRADDAGGPVDGLEKALDEILRGAGGRESLVRDSRGQRIRSPSVMSAAPVPGRTVVLSLNQSLQDIAERALGDAITSMRATGGDIVMLDPASGEVRAMASQRTNKLSTGATALTEPYEPGSTLKPFFAARLLDMGRARADEIINTYNGEWDFNGRKIEDDHPAPEFSLSDVIRYSSNIGIIQFAERLNPNEKFELLRDLGFGTPTGIPYPSESAGLLPVPGRWDGLTSASLAMGYAVSVTPLQLAAAYGAIANGGELLEPAIVHEIRDPDGTVTWRQERRVVRRVMSEESARALRGMLRGVVETGTAIGSNLSTFDVAGKTGTAKIAIGGRYVPGRYTASFVGMFPADDPQLVILVKLDDPTKSIYGGRAAAPVSKVVLQAALAARAAALDRRALADAPSRERGTADFAPLPEPAADVLPQAARGGAVAWVARLDEPRIMAQRIVARRAVPNVRGLPLRQAVYTLHRAGFRASLPHGGSGADRALATSPSAGTLVVTGSTVVLEREP
ncbi:MAG: penicillin-binding transpeptidase domain-containing protein [Gemmatimonadetes bacterium]|nr:penicillin-binding transpeptidase domain-containing protein [Gemmatimonadota bacterium]